MRRILDFSDLGLKYLLAAMFSVVLIAALVQVAARYLFEVTIIGPEELCRYLMIACTFIAIPVLAKSRNQIAVDGLSHFLPDGITQLWLARTVLVAEGAFLVLFGYFATIYTAGLMETRQASVGLGIPLAVPASTMVVGSLLGILVTALLLAFTFTKQGRIDPYGRGQEEKNSMPGDVK